MRQSCAGAHAIGFPVGESISEAAGAIAGEDFGRLVSLVIHSGVPGPGG